jgi:hypothetical protein
VTKILRLAVVLAVSLAALLGTTSLAGAAPAPKLTPKQQQALCIAQKSIELLKAIDKQTWKNEAARDAVIKPIPAQAKAACPLPGTGGGTGGTAEGLAPLALPTPEGVAVPAGTGGGTDNPPPATTKTISESVTAGHGESVHDVVRCPSGTEDRGAVLDGLAHSVEPSGRRRHQCDHVLELAETWIATDKPQANIDWPSARARPGAAHRPGASSAVRGLRRIPQIDEMAGSPVTASRPARPTRHLSGSENDNPRSSAVVGHDGGLSAGTGGLVDFS